jgi:predicted RND superfamily exporter protein
VQDFGVMMMLGSVVALASLVLLLPGLALAAGRFDTLPRRAWGEQWMDRSLGTTVDVVLRRPGTLGTAMLLLAAVGVGGSLRVQVESDFTRNFRQSSSLVAGYELVERNLGGAGVWDILVPAPAELDEAFLDRLRSLEAQLRALRLAEQEGPALTKVLSIADALDAAPRPPLLRLSPQQLFRGLRVLMPSVADALYAPDPHDGQHWARIMLRAHEQRPSQDKQWLIAEVARLAHEAFPGDGRATAEVTGFYVLLAQLIDSMLADQWKTFAAACGAIALMLLAAFRSPGLALAALVPNVLPIVIVTGLMGWCGLRINMGAAMIAAVSVGLSVDASIHYLAAYRRYRASGMGVAEALHAVQQRVGRAVTFSTLALIVGFGALCSSDFIPTVYFGALVGLAMLGGMAGNLLILPLLLSLYERGHPNRWRGGGPPDNVLRSDAPSD